MPRVSNQKHECTYIGGVDAVNFVFPASGRAMTVERGETVELFEREARALAGNDDWEIPERFTLELIAWIIAVNPELAPDPDPETTVDADASTTTTTGGGD